MTKNMYLIVLEGGGDRFVKVVDEETFNWVTSPDPGMPKDLDPNCNYWEDQLVPPSQQVKIGEPVEITSGSFENDRAIMAEAADGYATDYFSKNEAKREIRKNGDVLVGEFEGMMY